MHYYLVMVPDKVTNHDKNIEIIGEKISTEVMNDQAHRVRTGTNLNSKN